MRKRRDSQPWTHRSDHAWIWNQQRKGNREPNRMLHRHRCGGIGVNEVSYLWLQQSTQTNARLLSNLCLPLLGFTLSRRISKEASERVRLDEWVLLMALPHNWQRSRAKPVRVPQHCSWSPMGGSSISSIEPRKKRITGLQLIGMPKLAWRQMTTTAIKQSSLSVH